MAHAQPRVAALLHVARRPAETANEEVTQTLLGPGQIVRRIHRSENIVLGHLFVEGADKLFEAFFADAVVDLVFADQTSIIPSAALSWKGVMRSLVIGGTLFIGRALVRKLIERGDQVTIVHRGRHNPFGDLVNEVRCDRNDSDGMRRVMQEGRYELVFDNVYDWQRGTTAEQVEAAAAACGDQLKRYVFTSSCAAYGSGLNHDEDDALAPPDDPDAYCRNKANTERMLFRLYRERGLPVVTLRPPYLYGPENPFYREQFFWDRMLAQRPIILPGDGSRLMQFVYVRDYADAAIAAAERDIAVGRAYNVADSQPVTQRQLVGALAEAAGCAPPPMIPVEREALAKLGGNVFEPPFYFAQYYDMPPITEDTSRARSELGFRATPFVEGLRQTFAWYQSVERPEPDFSFDDKALAAAGYRAK